MIEKKVLRQKLIKRTLYTLAIFLVIFLCLDFIIYQRLSHILYNDVDNGISDAMEILKDTLRDKKINNYIINIKTNPRVICVIRNSARRDNE